MQESAPGYLKVEAVHAASYQGALHLDDVLARRARISIETYDRVWRRQRRSPPCVAPVLGWDQAAIDRIEPYRLRSKPNAVTAPRG